MADNSVPLSVVSSRDTQFLWASIAIGKNVLVQQSPSTGRAYWFVVIERSSLNVVYNQLQKAPNVAPNLGAYNTSDYILIVATLAPVNRIADAIGTDDVLVASGLRIQLAEIARALGRRDEALAHYRRFLAEILPTDNRYRTATERMQELEAAP